MTSYATVEEYRTLTGDSASDAARIEFMLAQQSAELREMAGIADGRVLTDGQFAMCRDLVVGACSMALVKPSVDAFGDLTGLTQGTFSANGFSASFQNANGTGRPSFDNRKLRALKCSLGTTQGAGTVIPSYGRL